MTEEIEEAVEPQMDSPIGQIVEAAQTDADSQDQGLEDNSSKKMIPLHVAQKLREQKRELELQLQWEQQERQRLMHTGQAPKIPEDDNSRYESATREDLSRSQEEIVRIVDERRWIKDNPEKYEQVNEYLPKFLKQRPHLAAAINLAPNRYEEAFQLMEALTPKQQKQLHQATKPPKQEAPNAPGGVPKAAALNEAVDVMNMTDAEFSAWRASKRKRR